MKLVSHSELRMVFTTGLVNAFGAISGLPFSYYAPLTVIAMCVGTYGSSLEMGRQRIAGSVLGSALLVMMLNGLPAIPMPIAIAAALGALRLLGGLLGLQVGYKAGGMLLVMGWLEHADGLDSWIPYRLGWTLFGIVVALISLRLIWPDRSLDQILRGYGGLSQSLKKEFERLAERVDPRGSKQGIESMPDSWLSLRQALNQLRRQVPALLNELGSYPRRHPHYRLVSILDEAHSKLVGTVLGLERKEPSLQNLELLQQLHQAESDLLRCLAERLGEWHQTLSKGGPRLARPPAGQVSWPGSWDCLETLLVDPMANSASLERQERLASRLVHCRQARRAIEDAEANWAATFGRS